MARIQEQITPESITPEAMSSLAAAPPAGHARPTSCPQGIMAHIYLLGGFRLLVAGREVADSVWRLRKAKSLLKMLALAPQNRLHRELVLDALWPDLDLSAAANNLKQALLVARRALGNGAAGGAPNIALVDEMLALAPAGTIWTDLEAFEAAAAHARRTRASADYATAFSLYGGELLPEDRFEDWAIGSREATRSLYLALLLEWSHVLLAQEQIAPAVEALRRAVAEEPTHDAALMRLYAANGQRHQALRQFQALRDSLQREFGVEPQPDTRTLYDDIAVGRLTVAQRPLQVALTTVTGPETAPSELETAFETGAGEHPAGRRVRHIALPAAGVAVTAMALLVMLLQLALARAETTHKVIGAAASGTATKDVAPPRTASDASTTPGSVLLADNFDNPATGLLPKTASSPNHFRVEYEGGEYVISKFDPEWGEWATAALPATAQVDRAPGGRFPDGTIAIDARLVGPTEQRQIGIACRATVVEGQPSHYRFYIRPDIGAFFLARWAGAMRFPLAEAPSAAIRRGTQTNHLELTCSGRTIAASINGTPVVVVEDDALRDGRAWIGVAMGFDPLAGALVPGAAEARFDNLVIRR